MVPRNLPLAPSPSHPLCSRNLSVVWQLTKPLEFSAKESRPGVITYVPVIPNSLSGLGSSTRFQIQLTAHRTISSPCCKCTLNMPHCSLRVRTSANTMFSPLLHLPPQVSGLQASTLTLHTSRQIRTCLPCSNPT